MVDNRTDHSPTAVFVVASVIGIALTAIFATLWLGALGTEPGEVNRFLGLESSPAEATAIDVITAITTYDSDTIEDVRERLLDLSTGDFRDDYEELLAGGLGDVVQEAAVSSEGNIVEGPLVGFTSATRALAVARVVQDVVSRDTPGGRTVFLVLRLGLTKEGDSWKADSLKVLSQQVL